mmetsp:Transcript_10663/g.22597  ORF Transcript_10663/g.22597 Transcript_10663/m.22597 type:complete len:225 (-) Transcript_10663:13-687(-)
MKETILLVPAPQRILPVRVRSDLLPRAFEPLRLHRRDELRQPVPPALGSHVEEHPAIWMEQSRHDLLQQRYNVLLVDAIGANDVIQGVRRVRRLVSPIDGTGGGHGCCFRCCCCIVLGAAVVALLSSFVQFDIEPYVINRFRIQIGDRHALRIRVRGARQRGNATSRSQFQYGLAFHPSDHGRGGEPSRHDEGGAPYSESGGVFDGSLSEWIVCVCDWQLSNQH